MVECFNNNPFTTRFEPPLQTLKPLKNVHIPLLEDYSVDPGKAFWDIFPSQPLPCQISTPIDVGALSDLVNKVQNKLSVVQLNNCVNVISDLTFGADSMASPELPALDLPNSPTMQEPLIAQSFTDTLATFVSQGTMIGPLDTPPFKNFRINQLFSVVQNGKLRPILNMSAPKGASFNESIDKANMAKVQMATAHSVGQAIVKKGQGCFLSKCDQIAAYKSIPVKHSQLRLQGFRWLSKIFIEAFLIFGDAASVLRYSTFHQAILDITAAIAQPEPDSIFSCLDDAVFISSSKDENSRLLSTYRGVGGMVNMSLADDTDQDKAFSTRTNGRILGVVFDTIAMTWSLDNTKADKFSFKLQGFLESRMVTQKDLMSALGIINTITIMAKGLRFFKTPIINDLRSSYEQSPLPLSFASRVCIKNWLRVIHHLRSGLPLCEDAHPLPPVNILSFTTDAAGIKKGRAMDFRIGAGAVLTLYPHGQPLSCLRALWPIEFISNSFDSKHAFTGSKSTTLEMLATILPLFHFALALPGKHVRIETDNLAVVWAFKRGRCPKDNWASLLLEAIMFVANSIPFQPFFVHERRCSSKPADWADSLSRSDKKGLALTNQLGIPEDSGWPPALLAWMEDPWLDHNLPQKLLLDFQSKIGNSFFIQTTTFQSLSGPFINAKSPTRLFLASKQNTHQASHIWQKARISLEVTQNIAPIHLIQVKAASLFDRQLCARFK
jgi:hypothetical protein